MLHQFHIIKRSRGLQNLVDFLNRWKKKFIFEIEREFYFLTNEKGIIKVQKYLNRKIKNAFKPVNEKKKKKIIGRVFMILTLIPAHIVHLYKC